MGRRAALKIGPKKSVQVCSICKEPGHNRRKCPVLLGTGGERKVKKRQPLDPGHKQCAHKT